MNKSKEDQDSKTEKSSNASALREFKEEKERMNILRSMKRERSGKGLKYSYSEEENLQ